MIYKILQKILNRKDIQKERHEQFVKSRDEITSHFNGVRINETLVGKIRSAKMDECRVDSSKQVKVLKTVERPMNFGDNLFEWLNHVRSEAKETMNKNHKLEKQEKEYIELKKKQAQKETAEKRREFFRNYGVLPKTQLN